MSNLRIEKQIEKNIIKYLEGLGAVVEGQQSGSIMQKKGGFSYKINLQKKGCPDIICLYKGIFYGIEVKKDEEEVNKWIKLREKYRAGETLKKSYDRELDQIKYGEHIVRQGGVHIITYQLEEIVKYFNGLNK